MSRRNRAPERHINPDPVYHSTLLAKFINHMMLDGKKSIAERITYEALAIVAQEKNTENPLPLLEEALENVRPLLEVKSKRVGGATYQVPHELSAKRSSTLAMRWLINAAKQRKEKSMAKRLAMEILDALENRGAAVKKREEVHKMADANKAFSHYS